MPIHLESVLVAVIKGKICYGGGGGPVQRAGSKGGVLASVSDRIFGTNLNLRDDKCGILGDMLP